MRLPRSLRQTTAWVKSELSGCGRVWPALSRRVGWAKGPAWSAAWWRKGYTVWFKYSDAAACGWPGWYPGAMPRPRNERQALEEERAEIPAQIPVYRQELENGRPHKARRERLEWQLKECEKRLAEIEARLAAMNAAP
jgi:hypothetical protein